MQGIIGLLVLIADIYAIVQVVQSSADGVNKLIWVLIILLLPIFGVVAWYFAGPGGKAG
jgi:hypothetical protein